MITELINVNKWEDLDSLANKFINNDALQKLISIFEQFEQFKIQTVCWLVIKAIDIRIDWHTRQKSVPYQPFSEPITQQMIEVANLNALKKSIQNINWYHHPMIQVAISSKGIMKCHIIHK
jgi:hypothetical protein